MTKKFDKPGTKDGGDRRDREASDRLKREREEREERERQEDDATPTETFDEPTRPTDIVSVELDSSPALRMLWERVSRIKREERFALRSLGNQTLELHQNVDPGLARRVEDFDKRLHSIETTMRITKWILGFVLAATLGSIVVIATKIFTWGYGSGEVETRLKYLEKSVDSRSSSRGWTKPSDRPDNGGSR